MALMTASPAALSDAVPCDLACRGQDFVLRDGAAYYYFCHNLQIHGNAHLHEGEGGSGLRTVRGDMPRVRRIAWADRPAEDLAFSQDRWLSFDATPYPYGTHLGPWRIARIET